MSGFLYFIPRTPSIDDFRQLGLGYAFDQAPAMTMISGEQGPGGQSGTVYHRCEGPTLPQPLEWRAAAGGYWVGWHAGYAPGPTDLRRGNIEISRGGFVRLRDEHDWLIPLVCVCTVRDSSRRSGLPQIPLRSNDGAAIEWQVDPRYRALVEQAARFSNVFNDDEAEPYNPDATLEFCAALLGVYYRIGFEEILALQLLDHPRCELVITTAIDAYERLLGVLSDDTVAELEAAGMNWAGVRELIQRVNETGPGET